MARGSNGGERARSESRCPSRHGKKGGRFWFCFLLVVLERASERRSQAREGRREKIAPSWDRNKTQATQRGWARQNKNEENKAKVSEKQKMKMKDLALSTDLTSTMAGTQEKAAAERQQKTILIKSFQSQHPTLSSGCSRCCIERNRERKNQRSAAL